MKKIFLIEDEYNEYVLLSNHFSEWEFYYPKDLLNTEKVDDAMIKNINDAINDKTLGIVTLIVDIELFKRKNDQPIDKSGLEIIRKIRSIHQDRIINNKIIPIFCYSKHDDLKIEALKVGATNFISKQIILDTNETRFKFLKQSIHALSMIYLDVINRSQYLPNFEQIEKSLIEITESQKEFSNSQSLIFQGLLSMMKWVDYEAFANLPADENVEDKLITVVGSQVINEIKKTKLANKQKEDIDKMFDDIGDIIPPFKPFFKAFKLFSRVMD